MARGELPEIGSVVDGKYAVVRRVGEGGMGVVFEATHTALNQRVALKMLWPHLADQGEIVARFAREARTAVQLRSPHVARFLDVATREDGSPCMVMEFLDGHDLSVELEQRGQIEIAEAVSYVVQACEAMVEAHQLGIVHRDLKPGNLFLAKGPNGRSIKVLDFGISKVQNEDVSMTSSYSALGTALYMSPEQVRSAKHVDARSDVWALGVVFYELLAGRPPFLADSATAVAAAIAADPVPPLRQFRADVPQSLESVVMKALDKHRAHRFQSAAEFAAALEAFAAYTPTGEEARLPTAFEEDETDLALGPAEPPSPHLAPSPLLAAQDASTPFGSAIAHPEKRKSPSHYLGIGVGALLGAGVVAATFVSSRAGETTNVGSSPSAATSPVAPVLSEQAPVPSSAPVAAPLATPLSSTATPAAATPAPAPSAARAAPTAHPKKSAAPSETKPSSPSSRPAKPATTPTPAGLLPDNPG